MKSSKNRRYGAVFERLWEKESGEKELIIRQFLLNEPINESEYNKVPIDIPQQGNLKISNEEISEIIGEFGNGIRARIFFEKELKSWKNLTAAHKEIISKSKTKFLSNDERNPEKSLIGDKKFLTEENRIICCGRDRILGNREIENFNYYFAQVIWIISKERLNDLGWDFDEIINYDINDTEHNIIRNYDFIGYTCILSSKAMNIYSKMTPIDEWKAHYLFPLSYVREKYPRQFKESVFSYLFILILNLCYNLNYDPNKESISLPKYVQDLLMFRERGYAFFWSLT